MALTKKTVYSKLEYAAQAAVEWGVKHEYQIKELEAKLANDLSNSRAIHSLLVEAMGSLNVRPVLDILERISDRFAGQPTAR